MKEGGGRRGERGGEQRKGEKKKNRRMANKGEEREGKGLNYGRGGRSEDSGSKRRVYIRESV